MSEKFDFKNLDLSKEPDQKKFDEEFGKLPENERKSLVDASQDEASGVMRKEQDHDFNNLINLEAKLEEYIEKQGPDYSRENKKTLARYALRLGILDYYFKEHDLDFYNFQQFIMGEEAAIEDKEQAELGKFNHSGIRGLQWTALSRQWN